jgi:hypothetical protein
MTQQDPERNRKPDGADKSAADLTGDLSAMPRIFTQSIAGIDRRSGMIGASRAYKLFEWDKGHES